MTRELIVEWWEVWYQAPGHEPLMVPSGWPCQGLRPRGTYSSNKAAYRFIHESSITRDLHVVHVRRYRQARSTSSKTK